jgi:hypothetical protein
MPARTMRGEKLLLGEIVGGYANRVAWLLLGGVRVDESPY